MRVMDAATVLTPISIRLSRKKESNVQSSYHEDGQDSQLPGQRHLQSPKLSTVSLFCLCLVLDEASIRLTSGIGKTNIMTSRMKSDIESQKLQLRTP
jgi:hypothetical protein